MPDRDLFDRALEMGGFSLQYVGDFQVATGRDVVAIKHPAHGVIMGDTAEMKELAQAILDLPDFKG